MNVGGLIGGLIAGVLGAVLWAGLAYYGQMEFAILAWLIGAAVGIGVSIGSSDGGIIPCVVAVLITAASLVGGKYLAVQMAVRELDQQLHGERFEIDEEVLMSNFAYDYAQEQVDAGKRLQFRNGHNSLEDTESFEDLPLNIVNAAKKKLSSLSAEEKEGMIAEKKAEFEEMLGQFEGAIAQQGFIDSFSGIDIIFFLLGIFTAGKIALSDYIEE